MPGYSVTEVINACTCIGQALPGYSVKEWKYYLELRGGITPGMSPSVLAHCKLYVLYVLRTYFSLIGLIKIKILPVFDSNSGTSHGSVCVRLVFGMRCYWCVIIIFYFFYFFLWNWCTHWRSAALRGAAFATRGMVPAGASRALFLFGGLDSDY